MSTSTRGAFIVFEGLDRCGKSTQVDHLVQRLERQGRRARLQKFPDRTTQIGKMIDAYLQSKTEIDDHAIHLLFSANRWECSAAIRRDLASGITVIADRYAFSGIAFSAAKGLCFDFCLQPDAGLPLPDATLYLTLPPETAARRSAYGEERYESVSIQQAVRQQFKLVANEIKKRHGAGKWIEINADGTITDVEERVWSQISDVVEHANGSIGDLWSS
ncbi:thymidylate kinase [Cryptococcus deuterogattii 99/473]|uniref:Thymidylate kinase n=2 Tax=Cryptococcus deuterogattii TaxID=1859096 RepID=A0A0D0TBF0_9TREE|nr:thymidylate kinase [Cryptococcus deuterogattii R265]KIR43392.1 thymidylate kinase [Cryptococcus deuterogattii Ram5]KIR74725.1 thymidylate kinase [Cryptococcus deuterogattii CA1014]KIS01514.1 thymidylate kinase [Cryptococcus deuterogattii 2001/935-1]KIY57192.1 thymidylate kinase [Cryptococcus deuterogattii 99/473]